LSAGSFQFHRAVEQRKARCRIRVRNGEQKFRATNRAGGERRLKLDIGGLFAIEKKQRAAFEAEAVLRRRRGRLDFENRVCADADDAAVGERRRSPGSRT
jgi:hypothetical protein